MNMPTRTPLQDTAVDSARAALFSTQAPEIDTPQRVEYRMQIVLGGCYDEPDDDNDPGMAVRDLLTDVLHYCHAHNLVLENELAGAIDMAEQERGEWEERGLYA